VLSHFACRWDHTVPADPIRLYEEVDDGRNEVRKIHEYADCRLIRTDSVNDSDTSLSWELLPALDEIAAQAEFTVEPLTAAEFQAVWDRATILASKGVLQMRAVRHISLAAAAVGLAACTAVSPPAGTAASVAPSTTQPPSSQAEPPFRYDASPFPVKHHPVRRAVSEAVDTLQNLIQNYSDANRRFGGSWIADDGQSLSVAVTAKYWSSTAPHLVEVMHRTHPDAPFHVVKVRYSQVDLEALQHQVFTLVYGQSPTGSITGTTTLTSVGTVVQQNRLNAQLLPGHDDIAYKIRSHFGSWIIITNDGSVATAV
jgi:hypothetical protein